MNSRPFDPQSNALTRLRYIPTCRNYRQHNNIARPRKKVKLITPLSRKKSPNPRPRTRRFRLQKSSRRCMLFEYPGDDGSRRDARMARHAGTTPPEHKMKANTPLRSAFFTGCLCACGCEILHGMSYAFTKQSTNTAGVFSVLGWRSSRYYQEDDL